MNTWLRRVLYTTLTLMLTTATLAGIAVAGVIATSRSTHQTVRTGASNPAPASLGYAEPVGSAGHLTKQGRRLVVAFVAGQSGTVASDLLAPYDIFASSPAFTTYVVAAGAGPAPLEGGPAVVPTHTFADVDADPALTPDLIVVPALSKPTGESEAPLRRWVSRQHDAGARVLGVCAGALVLAATGMLDGLDATSHWSRINALQNQHPAVHWLRGRRYVEDGTVTTTAAVTSGVQGALHLVAELAGPAEAQRVADQHPELGWTPTEPTTIGKDHFAVRDWPVGLNYLEPWFRPTVGIALHDGVGELDATAAFEVYGQSAAAQTIAIATGDTVRTRHGLVLLTTPFTQAPDLSRVVVPGAGTSGAIDPRLRAWAEHRHLRRRTAHGQTWSGRSWRRRVHRCAAEPRRPHRRQHHSRDRENGRLSHHRAQPRPCAPVLAPVPARPRQPRGRNPPRRGPAYLRRRRTRRRERPRSSGAPRPAPLSGAGSRR